MTLPKEVFEPGWEPTVEVKAVRPPKEPVTLKDYFDHNLKCGQLPYDKDYMIYKMFPCGASDWRVTWNWACGPDGHHLQCNKCKRVTWVRLIPDEIR